MTKLHVGKNDPATDIADGTQSVIWSIKDPLPKVPDSVFYLYAPYVKEFKDLPDSIIILNASEAEKIDRFPSSLLKLTCKKFEFSWMFKFKLALVYFLFGNAKYKEAINDKIKTFRPELPYNLDVINGYILK